MKTLIALCLIAVFSSLSTPRCVSADKPVPAEKPDAKAHRPTPFRGKIASVDTNTKILTVGERKFLATPETKIVKAGKPATLADAVVGEEVGGAYRKSDDGKLQLVSLRLGAKSADEKK